jgi:hypothetical protein
MKRNLPVFIFITGLMILCGGLGLALQAQAAPPGQEQEPLAVITSPRDNSQVTHGQVLIMGSADHPQFWKYEVAYGPEPNPEDQWSLVGVVHESPVVGDVLERWDTTALSEGVYSLRLRVVRLDGNYDEFFVRGVTLSSVPPTDTPVPQEQVTETVTPPAATPTPLPPTPTILIEQPTLAPTPTPRPMATEATPAARPTVALSVESLDLSGLGDAFCLGAEIAGGIFLLFGLLSLMRRLVLILLERS